jgi:glycosyltransferase involved in cell wall biosynthesis
MKAAQRSRTLTLVDIGTRHPRLWRRAAEEECQRFNIATREGAAAMPEALMRRQEREFQLCDHIVVPSSVARESFAEMGYGEKTVVVPGGVDTQFFFARSRLEQSPIFRACFVGRLEVPKGLGYLLQAWKSLALARAELLLVGAGNPEMEGYVKANGGPSVRMVGMLPPHEVATSYRESSVFVFPSVTEGLAQVLLEAMASGLPVIASERSGAGDCVAEGKEGFVVPTHDADALADAILWCYQHPAETYAMGRAARTRIENEFTLEHYNQRQIALYRTLGKAKAIAPVGRIPADGAIRVKG